MITHDQQDFYNLVAQPLPHPFRARVYNHTGRHIATLYERTRDTLQARAQRFCSAIGRGWAEYPDDE
ncbi:hypothetical protein CK501_05625 [Halovibrio salipaludis]|uniref:Uncharacterized protein n=1 Tax=Halovibrio salipaludis TaxID=2032626 RepID=A0A2A2F8V7_9GAMM|nr:hypothetical protein [Halovibrio salipaludis]PAU81042.1 hypothetical protein CK501_05625 [Halovibrio salipaludis]